ARIAGLAVAIVLFVAGLLFILSSARIADLVVIAVLAAAVGMARVAFSVHVTLPPAAAPQRPVLFFNPKSGGGKAEKFKLAEEAHSRGIEPIELRRGDDLEALVRDAVASGADAVAVAGGDGTQAIVAAIAAERGLPYACIPAGTRNHFALDLGVDRDDVVGALDAFVDGGRRRVDLAEVNGRVFVNNVSLGVYAEAVQRPGYRESKIRTLLDTVPDALGPDRRPWGLRVTGPDGREPLISRRPAPHWACLGAPRPRARTRRATCATRRASPRRPRSKPAPGSIRSGQPRTGGSASRRGPRVTP